MLTAAVLYERAVEYGNAGRHAVARRTLDEASRRADDADLSARIDGTIAYLEAETGDPAAALKRCTTARATPGISAHTHAVLTSQLGLIELRRGDLIAALPHLSAAAKALGDDPARLGRVVLNRGLVHLERGDIGVAEADFADAAEAFDRVGDRVERAKAQHNQGYSALIRGDLVAALRLMDEAREVLASLSPVSLAVCDLDRAEVLRAAGMTTEASRLLQAAARIFGVRRLRQMQADAELTLAGTLLDSAPGAATVVARRAARRYRARGNETAALRADACELAAAVLAGRAGAALRARIESTVASLRERQLVSDARALELQGARLDVRRGHLSDVATTLDFDAGGPITTVLVAHEVGAELASASHRPDLVMDRAGTGLRALSEWQATFGSIDLLSSTAARGRRLAVAGIDAALSTGDPAAVFEWSERTRSLAGRVMPVRPPSDPVVAAQLSELRRLRLSGADPGREAGLTRFIRERQWSGDGSRALAAIVSLDTARAALEQTGADLVCFLWSHDRISALVSGTDTRVIDLGPWEPIRRLLDGLLADLDMAAADLPDAMANVVRAALDKRLRELDDVLIATLGALAPRLVITPAGALSGVPWSMLPSLAGRSLTLPVSASRWVEQVASPTALVSAGFVAGPGVHRADDEVEASSAEWDDAVVLRSHGATCAAASALATGVDVLHVSAHGRHSVDNPLFSGVDLADGPWFGYDIDQVDRVPAVIVLSACEVGRSASGWGRESLGMAQSWLHAGARAVIAAPASVSDSVASELLPAVHASLSKGVAPSDALAAAGGRRSCAFQVYGSGLVSLEAGSAAG